MKKRRTRGDTKGFLFEADDISRVLLCRDVRGFPVAAEAARDRRKSHPGRLVIVVPNNDLEDWLARFADDASRVRRTVTITRRTDDRQIKLIVTLLTYGAGVDTVLAIERLMHDENGGLQLARGPAAAAEARETPDLLEQVVRRKTQKDVKRRRPA